MALDESLLQEVATSVSPLDLAGRLYRHCAPLATLSRIDLLCSEGDGRRRILCFLEAPSLPDAHRLARALGIVVFGEQSLVFELPHPDGLVCRPCVHAGDAALPVRVTFDCLHR